MGRQVLAVGSLRSFKNATDKTARMIISVAPAGLEKMFFEVGVPVKLGETPLPPTKAEIEKLLAVAPNYGLGSTAFGPTSPWNYGRC